MNAPLVTTRGIAFFCDGGGIILEVLRDDFGLTAERKVESFNQIVDQFSAGPGMAPDQAQKLFTPFQTAGSKTTGGEQSSGLSLVIVKAIVDQHGGTMTVESKPGHGSTFTASFPLHSPE